MSDTEIRFNDKPLVLEKPTSVEQLVKEQELPETGFAIALNNKVLPRSQWANKQLEHGDSVNLFRAIAGG
ncbi:sulfur carrier protein thiS [Vibrio sp. JCM 19236]|nr:sulfur carrier protein thiS [Vibrio sp. JCM 19236]